MVDKKGLTEYELERLDNMSRNQEMLKLLGIVDEDNKSLMMDPGTTSRKRKPHCQKSEKDLIDVAVRKSSRLQGVPVKTYHECNAELDEIEKEEARRLKMKQRQSSTPKHFKQVNNARVPAQARVKDEIEYKRFTREEVLQIAPTLAEDKTFNKMELEKLALFGFTSSHLQAAKYPPRKIQIYNEFLQLVKLPKDVVVSSKKLAPYNSYKYTTVNGNPTVQCDICSAKRVLTSTGELGKHDCRQNPLNVLSGSE